MRWVLLAYRLPREPSTPRISLWRKLRRLGAVQIVDGLVALPLDARTREHFEWLADEVLAAGGEASVWLAEPTLRAEHDELAARMTEAVAAEYRAVIDGAAAARDEDRIHRRRALARLRRQVRNIDARDFFSAPAGDDARRAVRHLAELDEVRR